jgi:hypothetical protein
MRSSLLRVARKMSARWESARPPAPAPAGLVASPLRVSPGPRLISAERARGDPDVNSRLEYEIDKSWLAVAAQQVVRAHVEYQRLYELLTRTYGS